MVGIHGLFRAKTTLILSFTYGELSNVVVFAHTRTQLKEMGDEMTSLQVYPALASFTVHFPSLIAPLLLRSCLTSTIHNSQHLFLSLRIRCFVSRSKVVKGNLTLHFSLFGFLSKSPVKRSTYLLFVSWGTVLAGLQTARETNVGEWTGVRDRRSDLNKQDIDLDIMIRF